MLKKLKNLMKRFMAYMNESLSEAAKVDPVGMMMAETVF